MFMRSLAMSSIQPLGHKLPKALNLIHKDIRQLPSNAWYFISIVMTVWVLTTSIYVSSEKENKKDKARDKRSVQLVSLCLGDNTGLDRIRKTADADWLFPGSKHNHSSSQRFLSRELLEEFTSFLCPQPVPSQSSVLRL